MLLCFYRTHKSSKKKTNKIYKYGDCDHKTARVIVDRNSEMIYLNVFTFHLTSWRGFLVTIIIIIIRKHCKEASKALFYRKRSIIRKHNAAPNWLFGFHVKGESLVRPGGCRLLRTNVCTKRHGTLTMVRIKLINIETVESHTGPATHRRDVWFPTSEAEALFDGQLSPALLCRRVRSTEEGSFFLFVQFYFPFCVKCNECLLPCFFTPFENEKCEKVTVKWTDTLMDAFL